MFLEQPALSTGLSLTSKSETNLSGCRTLLVLSLSNQGRCLGFHFSTDGTSGAVITAPAPS